MQKNHKLDVHGLSVRGLGHEKNHDHFAIATLNKSMRLHQSNLTIDDDSRVHGHNQGHLFLVADGISGGPAPARASGTAVDSIVQYFLNEMPWYHLADGQPDDITLALEDAVRNAQEDLLRSVGPGNAGLGTTMTLAFVFWPHLYIAHVGDSRCYLQRGPELPQLTTDHTLAEARREVGGPVTDGGQHVLWNAVGGHGEEVQPEVRHVLLESGDVLALVTDGVTGPGAEDQLHALLDSDAPAEEICGGLVRGPGRDDRTAVVARFVPLERARAGSSVPPSPSPLVAHRELLAPGVPLPPDESVDHRPCASRAGRVPVPPATPMRVAR